MFKRVRSGSDYYVPTPKYKPRKMQKLTAPVKKDVKKEIAKQILNSQEKKWCYTEPLNGLYPYPVYNGGGFITYLLNGTHQGTGGTERVGRDFSVKKIEVHASFGPKYTAGVSTCVAQELMFALVYDKKPEGATPNITTIFSWDAGTKNRVSYGILNPLYNDRFRLLYKKIIKIPNFNATTVTGQTQYPFQKFNVDIKKKYKNGLITKCANTDAGDVSDINVGAVFALMAVSENVSANNDSIQCIAYDTKIVFTDA